MVSQVRALTAIARIAAAIGSQEEALACTASVDMQAALTALARKSRPDRAQHLLARAFRVTSDWTGQLHALGQIDSFALMAIADDLRP